MRTLALCALAGCMTKPVDVDKTGPTIRVYVDPTDKSRIVFGDSADPFIVKKSGMDLYELDVIVETTDGESMSKEGFDRHPTTMMDFSLSVTDTSIPDVVLAADQFDDWKTPAPITVPGSAMGKTLQIHAQGTDDQGLHSNVVDWAISLR